MALNIHITGRGLITSAGLNAVENWKNLCEGRNFFRRRDSVYEAPLSPEAEDLLQKLRSDKLLSIVDRIALMGILASREASLGVRPSLLANALVVMGTSRGALKVMEDGILEYEKNKEVDRFFSLSSHIGSISSAISYSLGSKANSMTVGSACISGVQAIGLAATLLQGGHGRMALAGGMESPLTQFTISQLTKLGILTGPTDDFYPCKPFHPNRRGTVFGEGSGVLLLETNPVERTSLGVIRSYAATIETGMTPGHSEQAVSLGSAISQALEMANIKTTDIDLIVGHGSGTAVGDKAEQACYQTIFGDRIPTLALNKWSFGHLVGGAGAVNAVMATFHLENNFVPGHIYHDQNEKLKRSHRGPINTVLVTSLGLGGAAAAMVIQKS